MSERITYTDKDSNSSEENKKVFYDTDANEVKDVVNSHADDIESLQAQIPESPNPFYGTFTSIATLILAHPTGELNAWAIVDAGAGISPQIAIWDNVGAEWEISGAVANVQTVSNFASLPTPGVAATIYITLDTFACYIYHASSWELLTKRPYFINLLDAFSSYSGQASKLIRVNKTETGIETVPVSDIYKPQQQRAVINIVDNTAAPPTETEGDRYILDNTGASHANWDGAAAWDIVEFDGTDWVAATPAEGWTAYVDALDDYYRYIDDGTPTWELNRNPLPTEEQIVGSVLENLTLTGSVNVDMSAGASGRYTLTGNTTVTLTNTPASGETITRTYYVDSSTTESFGFSNTTIDYGEYVADGTLNSITVVASNYPTTGLEIHVYYNQP